MLKCKNVLLAFLTVFSLFSVPISGEETPPQPEISQPAAAEEEEEQDSGNPEESSRPEDPTLTEEPPSAESSEEPTPTPENEIKEEEKTPEPTPAVPEEKTPEEPEEEITESETVEETGGDDVIDLHETLPHAAARLMKSSPFDMTSGNLRGGIIQTDAGQLISKGRVAQFDSVISPGQYEYISLFFLGDKVCYCVEPTVQVSLVNGYGSDYSGRTWESLDEDTRNLLKRISYFGYGFPSIGTSKEAYVATQLLIWKIVAPDYYDTISNSLHMCPSPHFDYKACYNSKVPMESVMNQITFLVENYDTVPSFADPYHRARFNYVDWGSTLTLTDSNNVLSWFNDYSEEEHKGMHLKTEDNRLLIDIDDLYYDGWNTSGGKTLTFRRKADQWENMLNGVLLYEAGDQQKLMAATGSDPTPQYQLSFKLRTSAVVVRKMDEYHARGSFAAGTEFYVGWYEDPETQYQKTGGNDMNWTEYHDPDRITRNDEDGNSNIENVTRMYYPIMTEDGSSIRRFPVDPDGILRINGFLPQGKKWWIREVKSANAFDTDDRPWSVETTSTGASAVYSFVNRLRDVTLELTKQDEEDPVTKINGAKFVFYETGDLDLSKDPTDYGTEVNLGRMKTPAITYRQLKERSGLEVGDSFVFNGFLYEIREITDSQYILDAVKASQYQPADTNCFSRYQLKENPSVGDEIEAREVSSMHGTFDTEDDDVRVRKAVITDIQADSGFVTVSVNETEQKANILVNETSEPDFAAFEAASQEQNVPLQRGSRLEVGRTVYTLKSINSNSLIASPDRKYTISLRDPKPEWSDIPDARNLMAGDQFVLCYPYSEDGSSYEMRQITFTVLQNGPYAMKVEADGNEMTITAPEWISYEDIPETVSKEEQFIVTAVQNPVYIVSDSRGNRYKITDRATEVIHRASEEDENNRVYDGLSSDLSYQELIGGEQTEGGACLDPYDPKGCPVGLTRQKELAKVDSINYAGPQYEEVDAADREVGKELLKDGVVYRVKEVDEVSLILSFGVNGMEYLAEVNDGRHTDKAFHTTKIPVTFTVEERDEKQIDVDWQTIQVPKNSLTSKSSLHLYAYAEEGTQGDLSWQNLPENAGTGSRFTDANNVEYTVLYAEEINQKAIVESFRGRYEVTPEAVRSVMPVTWQTVVDQETERGAVYKPGDTFLVMYNNVLSSGDVFEKDGIRYLVVNTDYEDDGRGTMTLRNGSDYQKKLVYAWNADAPLSAEELTQTSGPIEIDGISYEVIRESASGYETIRLQAEDGKTAETIIVQEVTDSNCHDPYEEQEPSFRVEVDKPQGLQYEDADLARYGVKKSGMHVRIDDVLYEIQSITENEITVRNTAGEVFVITEEAGEEDPFTLETFRNTPTEWIAGDTIEVQNETYRILSIDHDDTHGTILKVKKKNSHTVETAEEFPDLNTYETEALHYYRTGNTYSLPLKPGEWSCRLRSENPHIRLENIDGTWTLSSDANATAVLEITDADGDIIRAERIIFSLTEPEGEIVGLPVFAGITGHQYIRIVDSTNHNMPIAGKQVIICSDESMNRKVKQAVSDSYGTVDVSDLEPGTYWYLDPITEQPEKFDTVSPEHVKGQLRVNGLKWGRTYLACEAELPEGYDYGTAEVTHTFTMNADAKTNTIQASLENRLRRIAVKVYKVDQDDHRIPLNNAWFTAEDVTDETTVIDEKQSSSYREKITIADIPDETNAGDIVSVWPIKTTGKKHIYRIEKVLKEEVILSRLEDGSFKGSYHIPVNGYSVTAPMQYTDITRSLKNPRAGAVFEQIEKEPVSAIRQYQVISVKKEAVPDVFGELSGKRKITECQLIDLDDSSKTVFTVRAVQNNETYGAQMMGEYVSGGILMRSTHEENRLPITFEEALHAGLSAPGDSVKRMVNRTAEMPGWQLVHQALEEQKETLSYGGETWSIRSDGENQAVIRIRDLEYRLTPATIPGAAGWQEEDTLEVISTESSDENLTALTVRDSRGNTWYLTKDISQETVTTGTPGIYVKVAGPNETVLDGYTGADGRIVFADLAEGDYLVSKEDVVSPAHVEKGMILLPEVKYGHSVRICETKSPLGYLIGEACAVIVPKSEYTVDTVTNTRTNAKVVTRRKEIRKILISRRTGENYETETASLG